MPFSQALAQVSPRLNPRPIPFHSILIYGIVYGFWVVLLSQAFLPPSFLSWSIGMVYAGYDSLLLAFVAIRTLPILYTQPNKTQPSRVRRLSVGVIIAAHNEGLVLKRTIDALLQQGVKPDQIIVADDGSVDDTPAVFAQNYGLEEPPALKDISAPSPVVGALRWLRLPHGGKARALNGALQYLDTDVVLTVDADTLLDPTAIAAIVDAFEGDPALMVGGGVLTPVCDKQGIGRFFQWFQTYEYIRNFMARYAWASLDSLLLISGAFAAFRRDCLVTVGGFDPAFLVEDYELIHRIHRYAADHGLIWRVLVLGNARGITEAPSRILPFLRQRRRWFSGFLQTQYWNRDMTGTARFGALGLIMMPIKAFDTFQPIYGLAAFVVMLGFLATGRVSVASMVLPIVLVKMASDFMFNVWSIRLYRRWTGNQSGSSLWLFLIVSIIEPFSFLLLRHVGAAWGWLAFVAGRQTWDRQKRIVEPHAIQSGTSSVAETSASF